MATREGKSVRIDLDLVAEIEAVRSEGDDFKGTVHQLIEKGLKSGNGSQFQLDDEEKHQFFSYLAGRKDKQEYHDELIDLELTERELVDLAIEKSGKSYGDLLRDALLSAAKEEITLATRRAHQDLGIGSPKTRMIEVIKDLADKMYKGQYKPRGGLLNVSGVCSTARVNYKTAKSLWSEIRRENPELATAMEVLD